jgi:hypothetical protein
MQVDAIRRLAFFFFCFFLAKIAVSGQCSVACPCLGVRRE